MDAADLHRGFKLGECLVEPGESRVTGPSGCRVLPPEQFHVLLCLARKHGETVPREELRQCAWPRDGGTDAALRAAIRQLREALGGSVRDRRYIVGAGRGGFALVAHFEPAAAAGPRSPAVLETASIQEPAPTTVIGRLQHVVGELRRRNVLKVAGAYLVGMWLVLQVAETTFEPLRLPDWWLTALTILVIVGLPIVVVLAWSYEITPDGIELDPGRRPGLHVLRARRAIAPALVIGVALIAGVTGYALWQAIAARPGAEATAGSIEPSARSIAVLPFIDMSPTGTAAYLGDGLSEELSSDIAKLPGMRVAARTSAFALRGEKQDVRTIGRKLGVRYVLEGSVRRDGERVRVTAQLIDSSSGFHVWTESYDRSWQDLITIQQEISQAIARELHAVISPELAEELRFLPTKDPRAYDYYLAGLSRLRQGGTLGAYDNAAQLFRRALAADPGFVRALAGLCEVAIKRYERTRAAEQFHDAETSCRAALQADGELTETELALAKFYVASGHPEQAEQLYRSLIARLPRDAEAHIGLGRALARVNRPEEAERSFREAILVEPGYWAAYNSLGSFLFEIGRSQEAAEAFARVTELAPDNPSGFNNLGAARLAAGDLGAAAQAFERSSALAPSRSSYGNLGALYYYLGRMDDAVAMYTRAIELAPEEFKLWGGRADANWYRPKHREQALEDYRHAAELAERTLAVDATDGQTWAMLGYFWGRLGDADRASRYVARALEREPGSPFVNYFAAIEAADRGDREAAAERVARAIESGYAKALIVADPSLKGVPAG